MNEKELSKQYVEEAPYHPGYEDVAMPEMVDPNAIAIDAAWKEGFNAGYNTARERMLQRLTHLLEL